MGDAIWVFSLDPCMQGSSKIVFMSESNAVAALRIESYVEVTLVSISVTSTSIPGTPGSNLFFFYIFNLKNKLFSLYIYKTKKNPKLATMRQP